MRTLIFIHGRGQQGKDPEVMRRLWCSGLNAGLTLAGMPLVDPPSAVLPYFGDLLHAKETEAVQSHADIDLEAVRRRPSRVNIDPLMPPAIARTETAILQTMALEANVATDDIERESLRENILRVPGASRIATLLADLTDADQELIERFLRDVAVYLEFARDEVQKVVRAAARKVEGELVVVGHSLGAVVAREMMYDTAIRKRTRALVTVGSPLGIQGVYNNLATPGTGHPGTDEWLTVYDPADFVALGHPVKRLYGEPIEEMRVHNRSGHVHDVDQYLGHREVARWIGARIA